MKFYALFIVLLMFGTKAFPMGDPSILPDDPSIMTDTVGTLNQITPEETEKRSYMEQQDLQEKQFQQEREREQKEWNRQKELKEGRTDPP